MVRLTSILLLILSLIAPIEATSSNHAENLVKAAKEQIGQTISYNGTYKALDYPGGDVPLTTGVCTDVIVRAYRAVGIDLQVRLHEDISSNFVHYPIKRIWGQTRADRNIDHRRVPNLKTYFTRHGANLPIDLS